jgi:hypothetical protein
MMMAIMKKLKWGWKVDFTAARRKSVDRVLVVNGCQHAWLEAKSLESDRGQKVVSVKGEMVDDQYFEEGDTVKFLGQRVCSWLEHFPPSFQAIGTPTFRVGR